ncbi:MAG: hypothetical protein AMXMBFR6_21690 [Betaproteobacteria bacterium]|nr:DUF3106 domain-containing protein [Rhodocyclaceae bacterium]
MVKLRIRRAITVALACLVCQLAIGAAPGQDEWQRLSAGQRQILSPLAGSWARMDSVQRDKWLRIVARYPSMTPDEQDRIQRRMANWAGLTPDQRQKARDRYRTLRAVPADQRSALADKWREYQDLPPDERQRLKAATVRGASAKTKTPGAPVTRLVPGLAIRQAPLPQTKPPQPPSPSQFSEPPVVQGPLIHGNDHAPQ